MMRAPLQDHRPFARRRTAARRLAAACALAALALAPAAAAAEENAAAGEAWPDDPTARALLEGTLANLYEGDFVQVFRLESRRGRGRGMTRRLQIVRKESDDPGRAMLRFLSPEDVRGSSMLVIEHEARADDVFLYLPAAARTRRISLAQRYDSFFGTNLTYEDLEPKRADDFEARLVGRSEVDCVRCLVIEIRPRPGVESQYDRSEACIDPERDVALRTDYFVDGRRIKRLVVDPRTIDHVDGRFVPRVARLESTERDFTTEITSELYERKASIPDRLFTASNLEAGDDQSDLRALREAAPAAPPVSARE